ncbi:DUF2637 domain-containing protein [Rhodococcus erythropolis]|nr:DUF2637 domain-containing protein [Rhodococcus erythropolis]
MNDFSLRAARIQLGALLAALALAIIALGITTGAFVLSFAVQRDFARQALIPENLTWIFPAIVDSAILGATIAIVIKLNMNKRDRGFYSRLRQRRPAIAAQESIDGGGDLGFIPLAPAIAAAIAIIPSVLVLAFTHGITILVKAVGMAYAAYRSIVENATDSEDATSIASDLTVGRGPIRVPQPREKIAHNIAEQEEEDLDVDAKAVDAKAGNEDAVADFAEPFFVDEMTNEGLAEILDPQDAATEFPDLRAAEESTGRHGCRHRRSHGFHRPVESREEREEHGSPQAHEPEPNVGDDRFGVEARLSRHRPHGVGTRSSIAPLVQQDSTAHHCPTCEPPRTRCAANSPPFDPHPTIKGWPRQCYEHRQGR